MDGGTHCPGPAGIFWKEMEVRRKPRNFAEISVH